MPELFGHRMLKHFAFEEGWCNINNGMLRARTAGCSDWLTDAASFGSVPQPVLDALHNYQQQAEARPDEYIRYKSVEHLNASRKAVAEQLSVPAADVVMVTNATTGINTVMRNLKYKPEDVILYFSTTYGACQKIALVAKEYSGCQTHRIELRYPMSDEDLLQKVEAAIAELTKTGLKPKVLLFDTLLSLPGVRMPFERLTENCKNHGILSVIDGAHGYGQMRLDLRKLDPDFFVSNCHKWGFVPRPCAVMYVPERNQHLLRTTFPTSHYFVPEDAEDGGTNPLPPPSGDDTAFTKMFEFVGSADSSPYLSVPSALKFRREVCGGEERLWEYCYKLAAEGGALVARMLGTEVMDNSQGSLTKENAMVNIRLPFASGSIDLGDKGPGHVVQWGQKTSMEYRTFIPFFWHADAWWVRLSAQVYIELSDFEKTGEVLQQICRRIEAGEHLA